MEQDQNQSLFGLNIDEVAKSHLSDAAKWGKFLAIIGFIGCGIMVLFGIITATSGTSLTRVNNIYEREGYSGLGGAIAVELIVAALLYFFPCLFLLRFSNKIKTALVSNDQHQMTISFQNLKAYFRYIGVLTIIGLAIFLLAFLVGVLFTTR